MLHEQGAVVTGGSRGIGAAIVRRLAAEGAGVVFGYRSDAEAADAVVKEVEEAGGRAWAVAADTHVGRLDVLVNNAAVPARINLEQVSAEEFDRVFAINTCAAASHPARDETHGQRCAHHQRLQRQYQLARGR